MPLMIIAIDTAHSAQYSCIIFGYASDIDKLHQKICLAMFGKTNSILHWSKTSRKIKQKAEKKVFAEIQNSNILFFVFEHKKPLGEKRKNYYLAHIPNSVTSFIYKKLIEKYGTIIIESDRDFEVKGVRDATLLFIHNLLFQICFRLIGKPVTIRKDISELSATVKFLNGGKIEFFGRINNIMNSKAIQLADIVLGYKLNAKSDLEKVLYKKI